MGVLGEILPRRGAPSMPSPSSGGAVEFFTIFVDLVSSLLWVVDRSVLRSTAGTVHLDLLSSLSVFALHAGGCVV